MKMFDGYDQFINWIPEPRENGKTDKIPIGTEGFKIDPLDSRNWLSEDNARSIAAHTGKGVGFVFTEGDPFFFIDLDNHLDGEEWSDTAISIYTAFSGCYMEISQSGKGGHIFGCGKPEAPYRNTNKSERLEFYTEKRFVALTGTRWTGDTAMDGTAGLSWLIPKFFLKDKAAKRTILDWTSEPVVEWRGETDDEKLIAKAKRSRSVGSVFGGKASFSQLFNGDEEKLTEAYPPDDPTKPGWDNSSADMALCLHLAFWTGKDCERMERIFDQSRLGEREKWKDREEYRRRTIRKATENCKNVYGNSPNSEIRPTVALLDIVGQLEYFKGCVYVSGKHEVFTPIHGFLKPEVFRATYGGSDFVVRMEGATTKNAFRAFTESQLYRFPKADRTCFRPELPPGEIVTEEGLTYLNTYTPAQVSRRKGDITPFNGLLTLLLPIARDRSILLAYMAACVQYPGVKFQWAPLLQGVEGNGKSFLAIGVSKAIGERYTHYPNARDLDSRFTGWIENKLFIIVEEVFTSDKASISEALKPLITNPRIEIQAKGQNQYTGDNRANYFLCSNHKDAILKTGNDRRYCVFYTAQQEFEDLERDGMNGRYFKKLYDWAETGGWAEISEYLLTYDIPDEFNPTKECRRAPVTSSTSEALELSLSPVEQDILEAVEENIPGFRGGWISSIALSHLLRQHNHAVTPNKRRALLEKLGYVCRGRMSQMSTADGGRKPTLYCMKRLRVSGNVEQAYLFAQEGTKASPEPPFTVQC